MSDVFRHASYYLKRETVEFVEGSISMIVKQKKKEDLVRLADKMHVPSSGTMLR